MEGKKYWIVEGKNFDTHWTTQTDRVSFKSDDLWEFMEAYHQAKLKLLGIGDVSQQRELLIAFSTKVFEGLYMTWDSETTERMVDEYLKGNL